MEVKFVAIATELQHWNEIFITCIAFHYWIIQRNSSSSISLFWSKAGSRNPVFYSQTTPPFGAEQAHRSSKPHSNKNVRLQYCSSIAMATTRWWLVEISFTTEPDRDGYSMMMANRNFINIAFYYWIIQRNSSSSIPPLWSKAGSRNPVFYSQTIPSFGAEQAHRSSKLHSNKNVRLQYCSSIAMATNFTSIQHVDGQ